MHKDQEIVLLNHDKEQLLKEINNLKSSRPSTSNSHKSEDKELRKDLNHINEQLTK